MEVEMIIIKEVNGVKKYLPVVGTIDPTDTEDEKIGFYFDGKVVE